MRMWIVLAVKPVRDFQCEVPMVLGIISENTRISMVVNALTSPNHWEPNRIVACLPTPAAPMVFEIVLSERMAANALEGSCLYRLSLVAALRPSSSLKVMYEIGVLMRAASNIEQRKEMHRAPRRNIISSVILLFTTKILDISYTGDVLLVFAEMLYYHRHTAEIHYPYHQEHKSILRKISRAEAYAFTPAQFLIAIVHPLYSYGFDQITNSTGQWSEP